MTSSAVFPRAEYDHLYPPHSMRVHVSPGPACAVEHYLQIVVGESRRASQVFAPAPPARAPGSPAPATAVARRLGYVVAVDDDMAHGTSCSNSITVTVATAHPEWAVRKMATG